MRRLGRALVSCVALAFAMTAAAQTPLRVILVPGRRDRADVGRGGQGLLRARRASRSSSPSRPSSVFLAESLMKGDQDVALATFDNVVGYQEGQGEVALKEAPDFFAFMSVMHGTVHLVANPEIKTIADLKGKYARRRCRRDRLLPRDDQAAAARRARSGRLHARADRQHGAAARSCCSRTRPSPPSSPRRSSLLPRSKGYRDLANFGDVDRAVPGNRGADAALVGRGASRHAHRASFAPRRPRSIGCSIPRTRSRPPRSIASIFPTCPKPPQRAAVAAMTADRDGFTRGGRFDTAGRRQRAHDPQRVRAAAEEP